MAVIITLFVLFFAWALWVIVTECVENKEDTWD